MTEHQTDTVDNWSRRLATGKQTEESIRDLVGSIGGLTKTMLDLVNLCKAQTLKIVELEERIAKLEKPVASFGESPKNLRS